MLGMNYEKYLFVEKLFIYPQGRERSIVDESIASHQRLIAIAEFAYPSPQTFIVEDLIAAANRTIAYLQGLDTIDGTFYCYTLSQEQLDELKSKNSNEFYDYIDPMLAGYRLKFRDNTNSLEPSILDELVSLISWQTMSSGLNPSTL